MKNKKTPDKNKKLSRAGRIRKLIIWAVIIILLIIFCLYQNLHLVSSEYVYTSEEIGEDLDGFKIVQISDLHNATFGSGNERLLQMVRDMSPDIIAITGDMVDSSHTDIDVALEFARSAAQIAPTYYITGNHEYWLEDDERQKLLDGLDDAGVLVMINSSIRIYKGNDYFTLIGLDDNNLTDGTLGTLTSDEDGLRVLLAHEPQYPHSYNVYDMDLVLSGHAHGGQIRLPFIGGLVAPDQGLFPEYTAGTYNVGNMTMIVSRGLGNSVIPVRIFNYPEVVCVTLERKK